jgi:hypothetical protein
MQGPQQSPWGGQAPFQRMFAQAPWQTQGPQLGGGMGGQQMQGPQQSPWGAVQNQAQQQAFPAQAAIDQFGLGSRMGGQW